MAEIWSIPGRQRPRFWARQVRGLLLLVVFAVGRAATSLLFWLYLGARLTLYAAEINVVAARHHRHRSCLQVAPWPSRRSLIGSSSGHMPTLPS
jgi:hypothetical protein